MPQPASRPAPAPWRFFAPHRREPFAFFVDRGRGDRPSFAGSRPVGQLVVDADGKARCWRDGQWHEEHGDPVDAIAAFVDRDRAEPLRLPAWLEGEALPRTVGFLAYELGAWADGPRRRDGRAGPGTPLAVLSTYGAFDAWEPRGGRSARVTFEGAASPASIPPVAPADSSSWAPTPRAAWRRGFDRVREAIAAGDIYQANLSRRAVFDLDVDAGAAYARLREVQPVPWGAFLDFGGFALLSNSPERFLSRSGDEVVTSPIKGTRPRRGDPERDDAEAAALAADPKEAAEHLMIVDLERSDLGRVARTGSVRVDELARVERFATVHHLVSDVRATLGEGTGLAALLRATFPGGSITGAPKIRAMEILAEVEQAGRGPYCGAIGFFRGAEELELSIAIRTGVAAGGRLLYQAGGGIVADSDADREWDETELKVEALRRALGECDREAGHEDRARALPGATEARSER